MGQGDLVGYIELSTLLGGVMDGLNSAPGHSVTDGGQGWPVMNHRTLSRGSRCANFPCAQDCLCVAKSHILLKVTLLVLNTVNQNE
jgi:hypothetical protein